MKTVTLTCTFCKKSFERPKGQHTQMLKLKRKPYCSHKCSTEDRKEGKDYNCFVCNASIYRSPKEVNIKATDKFFCSQKCFHKHVSQEKISTRKCKSCDNLIDITIKRNRKLCDDCKSLIVKRRNLRQSSIKKPSILLSVTKEELFKKRKNWQSARSSIVHHAKALYESSGKIKACAVCGYSKHYQICHIKSVKDFSGNSTIAEINCIDNLIALCPNHHWEYDKGNLELVGHLNVLPIRNAETGVEPSYRKLMRIAW